MRRARVVSKLQSGDDLAALVLHGSLCYDFGNNLYCLLHILLTFKVKYSVSGSKKRLQYFSKQMNMNLAMFYYIGYCIAAIEHFLIMHATYNIP